MLFAMNFDWTFTVGDVAELCLGIVTLTGIYWALKMDIRVLGISYGQTRDQVNAQHQQNRTNFHDINNALHLLTLNMSNGQIKTDAKLESITEKLEHLDGCVDGIKSETKKDIERLWEDQKRQDAELR